MSRYIDADKAMEIWKDDNYILMSSQEAKMKILLDAVPSADVVKVVRCKECMHNGSFDTDCPFGWRDERFNLPDDIDFCSYGERKEE